MKFSLIGTGFIMSKHAEAINQVGGEIRDVVNDVHGQDAWREMIKTTDADCIVILTPNDLHFEMARVSAEAGKIVLCEKPLTIKSGEAKILAAKPNIFTVLQLHYHPLAKKLKAEIHPREKYEIEMDISVYRDPHYYDSWKGQTERSGGVLFNLGIHYFEMMLYLFGGPKKMEIASLDNKTGIGTMEGDNWTCRWKISTDAKRDSQRRVFKINGVDYNFSSKDNLAYENLHRYVYEDLLQGKGITPRDALKSIEIVEALNKTVD